jgi:hypothetical protein
MKNEGQVCECRMTNVVIEQSESLVVRMFNADFEHEIKEEAEFFVAPFSPSLVFQESMVRRLSDHVSSINELQERARKRDGP